MKKILKKENLILLAVLVQFGFLLIFNLTQTRYIVNMDSSEYLVQVMQIVRQGTLLIRDYYYSTALMWDMPTLLAVPFYAITKNIFLSWGIALDILLVLLFALLRKMTKDLRLTDMASCIVLLLVFTLYEHGLVDYGDMLLINGGTYLVRILLLINLLDLILVIDHSKPAAAEWVQLGLGLAGFFICGISTGIFAAGCIILPVCIYEGIHLLKAYSRPTARRTNGLVFSLIALAASLVGVVANKLLGLPASQESSKALVGAGQIMTQALNNLSGIFQLFGWPEGETALLSLKGIMVLCGFAAACVVIAAFVMAVIFAKKDIIVNEQKAYAGLMICAFAVNYGLFTLVDLSYGGGSCEYRYWLLVIIPAMAEVGIVIDHLSSSISKNIKTAVVVVIVLLLALIDVYHDKDLMDYAGQGRAYAAVNEAAMDLASENDVDVLYAYMDYYWGRQICTYSPKDMEVFAVADDTEDGLGNWTYDKLTMPRWGNFVKYDGSLEENRAATEGKKVAVLVDTRVCNELKELENEAAECLEISSEMSDSSKSAKKLADNIELLIFDENPMEFE